MIKLKVVNRDNYLYELEGNGKQYVLSLDFLDIEEKPKEGNYLYFAEKLLNPNYEGYSTSYTFGSLESVYGKKNISTDDVDVIKVVINEKEIYLKRLYG